MTWSSSLPGRRASRFISAALEPEPARSSRSAVVTQSLLLIALGATLFWIGWGWPKLPFSIWAPFIVVGGLYLTPIPFLIVGGTYLDEMVALTVRSSESPAISQLAEMIAVGALAMVIVLIFCASRSWGWRGLQGRRGELMFVA